MESYGMDSCSGYFHIINKIIYLLKKYIHLYADDTVVYAINPTTDQALWVSICLYSPPESICWTDIGT